MNKQRIRMAKKLIAQAEVLINSNKPSRSRRAIRASNRRNSGRGSVTAIVDSIKDSLLRLHDAQDVENYDESNALPINTSDTYNAWRTADMSNAVEIQNMMIEDIADTISMKTSELREIRSRMIDLEDTVYNFDTDNYDDKEEADKALFEAKEELASIEKEFDEA